MSKESQSALTIVRKAREDVKQVLSGPRFINNLLEINGWFHKIEQRLIMIGALLPETGGAVVRETMKHKPLTRVLDRAITPRPEITDEEIVAKKEELITDIKKDVIPADELKKMKYREAVNKLYARIGRMSPTSVLNNYKSDYDIKVLRGVARIAGLADYETAELTMAFVDQINEAIRKQIADADQQKVIDKSTLKKVGVGGIESIVVVTQEQIEDDPELETLGAKAGDTVGIDKKTKKKVLNPSTK